MHFLAQKKQKALPLPSKSMIILKKQYDRKKIHKENSNGKPSGMSSREISVVDLIRKARRKMSERISQNSDYFSFFIRPSEKSKDLELVLRLQAAALYFSKQQFDQARNQLRFCQRSASHNGNPLQKVLHHFTEALQEGILSEMGGLNFQEAHKERKESPAFEESYTHMQTAMLEFNETLPFCPVTQFTSVQAILDNVASARRIHVVDFGIKSGSQWPILMQGLLNRWECPLEYLKITAVGSSKENIEETGKKLSSFAASLNIPFEFRIVVSDLKNLDIDFFELAAEEMVVVYSQMRLATLLAWPHHLESVLETIKKLKPEVIVTMEVDSNTNAPLFMDRFNAVLSVSAAIFDCLDVCMRQESKTRAIIEGVFLREGIRYIVTSKGAESIHRQETISFWRAVFEKFGMVEIALSSCALYQANLVVKRNPLWNSCTMEQNGKGMVVGWKGTPVQFLTVWKC